MSTTSQKAYAQAVGTTSTGGIWIDSRGPSVYDVNYQIGQQWLDKLTQTLYYLANLSNASGQLLAQWNIISVESELVSLTGSANPTDVVHPSGTSATPPDNIQLYNSDGTIIITGDPTNNRIIFSLAGGSTAIEQLTPQIGGVSGTPVVPSGTPENININVTNGLTSSGSGSTLTITGINADNVGTIGVTTLATNASTINPGSSTSTAVTPAGLNAKLGTQTANGVAYGGGTTAAVGWTGTGTSSQALLGGTPPSFGQVPNSALANSSITVTGGGGILVTGSPVSLGGSVSITGEGGTFGWASVSNNTVTMTAQTGYVLLGTATVNMPVSASLGDTIRVWFRVASSNTIQCQPGQQIGCGNLFSTSGGTVTANLNGTFIELVAFNSNSWTISTITGTVDLN